MTEIQSYLYERYYLLKTMDNELDIQIQQYPKGSLVKTRMGYYQLKFRENGVVKTKYIGKDSDVVMQVKQRNRFRKQQKEVREELEAIIYMMKYKKYKVSSDTAYMIGAAIHSRTLMLKKKENDLNQMMSLLRG